MCLVYSVFLGFPCQVLCVFSPGLFSSVWCVLSVSRVLSSVLQFCVKFIFSLCSMFWIFVCMDLSLIPGLLDFLFTWTIQPPFVILCVLPIHWVSLLFTTTFMSVLGSTSFNHTVPVPLSELEPFSIVSPLKLAEPGNCMPRNQLFWLHE